MAVDRRAVFTDAVVFARIRQLNALGEVKPGLLTLGQMGHDPGVKQEVVIIGFAAFDGVGGARFAVGDILLLGTGESSDAYHMSAPHPEGLGARMAMEAALRSAGLAVDAIDYINLHGTSTPAGDKAEAQAVKSVFGDAASRVLVSSTKSMTGHLLGAAGAVESIYSILALRDQAVPPTINLDNPDEGIDLDLVPNTSRQARLDTVMSNSFGFGGSNCSVIIGRAG